MRKFLLAAVCAGALAPVLPAIAQSDPSQVGVTTAVPWSQTGRSFVQHMMMGDKFEIAASQLALQKSRDPAIREFAQEMIASHRALGADLKAASDSTLVGRTVTPPPAFDPRHRDMYNALQSSHGQAFDRLFIAEQFDAHHEALDFAEGYARHGRVWQLQDFARAAVPVIRDHLAMLHHIRGDVANGAAMRQNAADTAPQLTQ